MRNAAVLLPPLGPPARAAVASPRLSELRPRRCGHPALRRSRSRASPTWQRSAVAAPTAQRGRPRPWPQGLPGPGRDPPWPFPDRTPAMATTRAHLERLAALAVVARPPSEAGRAPMAASHARRGEVCPALAEPLPPWPRARRGHQPTRQGRPRPHGHEQCPPFLLRASGGRGKARDFFIFHFAP